MNNETKIKIIGVETDGCIYITHFKPDHDYSKYNRLSGYVINDEIPGDCFDRNWVKVSSIPTKVEKLFNQPNINIRWELKNPLLASDKIPLVLSEDDLKYEYDEDDESSYHGKYSDLGPLYQKMSDKQPDALKTVEFEYEKVMFIDKISDTKNRYSSFGNIQHQLVDRLIYPEIVLSEKPCSYSPETSYKIIRAYIKENINPKYAEITSDYDFCFTVKKKIKLEEPTSYTVDVNNYWFNKRKRKPKYETRYRKDRFVEVFEMAPKAYQKYTVLKGFVGLNHSDLQEKVEDYCKGVIEMINEPLVDCPHCKGNGVKEVN